jgi:hypothetical protein
MLQVMTLEGWQELMMSTVRASDGSAYLYFLAWVILSKYVFLMLFLAVVMDAFERSYHDMQKKETEVSLMNGTLSTMPCSTTGQDARNSMVTAAEIYDDVESHSSSSEGGLRFDQETMSAVSEVRPPKNAVSMANASLRHVFSSGLERRRSCGG